MDGVYYVKRTDGKVTRITIKSEILNKCHKCGSLEKTAYQRNSKDFCENCNPYKCSNWGCNKETKDYLHSDDLWFCSFRCEKQYKD